MFPGLHGRAVVVTGAASGQGLALALLLADAGARPIATDLADVAGPELTDAGIEYHRLDVSREEDWQAIATGLRENLDQPLRGLVNNAGMTHRARLGSIARADWDRVIGVNLTGAMLGIQALAPLMDAGSSIVNIGSTAALSGHYPASYTTSKWALRGLTHVAATEYGPRGIRVNIIHPGYIETPMTASVPDAMRTAQLALTPLERFGQAGDVAQTAAFLLSDASAYTSGAEIAIDGGFSSSAGAKLIADGIAAASASPT